jgi:hypothetical protein
VAEIEEEVVQEGEVAAVPEEQEDHQEALKSLYNLIDCQVSLSQEAHKIH